MTQILDYFKFQTHVVKPFETRYGWQSRCAAIKVDVVAFLDVGGHQIGSKSQLHIRTGCVENEPERAVHEYQTKTLNPLRLIETLSFLLLMTIIREQGRGSQVTQPCDGYGIWASNKAVKASPPSVGRPTH